MMTSQERRITRELGGVCLAYVAIIGAVKMAGSWGTVPQWLTVFIALGAGIIAIISILTQRDLARKRAAIDFFFKTEMDSGAVNAFAEYSAVLQKFDIEDDVKRIYDDKDNTDVDKVMRCLGIHELVAVGVNKKIFDEDVCFDFWSDELMETYDRWKSMIKYMREKDRSPFTFVDLEKVACRWKVRDAQEVDALNSMR